MNLSLTAVNTLAKEMAIRIRSAIPGPQTYCVYGVPRGGVPVAYATVIALRELGCPAEVVGAPEAATVIVDDIIDSGATRDRYSRYSAPFYSLVMKNPEQDSWVTFPWEISDEDESADDIPVRLLQYIGEDPTRGGLADTPRRFLKAWNHWTKGYEEDPKEILKVFEDGAENYDEMVVVRDIPVYSHCEHHLAPIFGTASVAYIPDGKIVGLSKLNRLVDVFARRLQVQERMTAQIADCIAEHLEPKGVGVVLRCRHLCMESRGICQQGHTTITSALRGSLKDEPEARAEFMKLVQ